MQFVLAFATDFFAWWEYSLLTGKGDGRVYIDLVMGINFAVDLLLLVGTNFLAGYPAGWKKCAVSSALGGIYAGFCLLPGFFFLSSFLWRLVILGIMSVLAFGMNRSAIRRGILFVFLSMALGGIALGLADGGVVALLAAAGGLSLLCALGFRSSPGKQHYANVKLKNGDRHRYITALYDTGNTLKDPLTGKQVILVGPEVAFSLLGLTRSQLADPFGTIGKIAGLRLIPYRSVGQPCGMLLGAKLDEVYVDGILRDMIVAFLPESLGNGTYEALAGGI